jgi:hypothetical protein
VNETTCPDCGRGVHEVTHLGWQHGDGTITALLSRYLEPAAAGTVVFDETSGWWLQVRPSQAVETAVRWRVHVCSVPPEHHLPEYDAGRDSV